MKTIKSRTRGAQIAEGTSTTAGLTAATAESTAVSETTGTSWKSSRTRAKRGKLALKLTPTEQECQQQQKHSRDTSKNRDARMVETLEIRGDVNNNKITCNSRNNGNSRNAKKAERRKKQKRQQMNFGGPSREKIVKRATISFKYSVS